MRQKDTRHTISDFFILDEYNDYPIANALLVDNSNSRSYTRDINGNVHVAKHKSGQFTFAISADAYQTFSFNATIKRGTQNDFTVRLKQQWI